jgi:3-oxoacyl-[acyl-carrier protein] reductase
MNFVCNTDFFFKDKIVFITGGNKGIGRSISFEFLKRGAKVLVLHSKDEDSIKTMENIIRKDYFEFEQNFYFYKGSISDKYFLKSLFSDFEKHFGRLDILINNAGITRDSLFIAMEKEDWEDVIDINLKGTYLVSFLAHNLLKKDKNKGISHIINISSISGVYGNVGQVNYSTTKGAIIGMTKLFANKYFSDNIYVNTIIPGLIETDIMKSMPQERIDEIKKFLIIDRLGTTEEIARAVLFLCSEYASYINGTSLFVDGGFMK